jgi:hypothetical protein
LEACAADGSEFFSKTLWDAWRFSAKVFQSGSEADAQACSWPHRVLSDQAGPMVVVNKLVLYEATGVESWQP